MTVSGEGSKWTNSSSLYVGRSGTGTLAITASGTVSNTTGYIGYSAGSNGSVTVSEGGLVSSSATLTLGLNAGSVGTLNIGAAQGNAAVTAGSVSAPTITFGAGTGGLILNHTASNYTLASAITGSGSIMVLSGITSLTGDLSAFTGTTTVSTAAELFLSGSYGGDVALTDGGKSTITSAIAGDLTLSGTSTASLGSAGSIGGDVVVGTGSTFSNNGTVSGDVDVNSGGTLQGSGTIGGDATINAGATIAPGNSIGTLNVVGDVNFAAGSIYDVEVNAQGQSDLIIATGNANITGGTVNLLPEAGGAYGLGTTYTFLTAANVIGTFDAITLNTTSLFLDAALSYDATHAYATFTRNGTTFSSVAATENQRAVGEALDSLGTGSEARDAMAGQSTVVGSQSGMQALSGELHAAIKGALAEGEEGFAALIAGRMQGDPAGLWAQAYGDTGERNGDASNTHVFRRKERGLAFGYAAPAGGALGRMGLADQLGLVFNYGRSAYDLRTASDNSASGDAAHYRLGAQGMKRLGALALRVGGQYGLHQIETDRTVAFAGYGDRLRADYGAHSLGGSVEAAYGFEPAATVWIEPFAQLNYGMMLSEKIKETGGDGALRARHDLASQGNTLTGIRLTQQLSFGGEGAQGQKAYKLLKAQLGWRRLIGQAEPVGRYNFDGSSSFTSAAAAAPRDAFEMNLGVAMPLTAQASVDFSSSLTQAPEASANSLRLGFNWRF